MPIRQEIVECTGRDASPGPIYTTLERLEDKGLVRSRFGDPTPERGGRAKRYFTLSARGGQALTRAQQSYQRLLKGVTLPERRVRRAAAAQAIIATTQDRAAAVVGDLLEEESSGGRVRFWWNVAGTTLAFAWLNIVRFIFRRHFGSGADNRGQVMEFWRFVWRRKWLLVVPVVVSTIAATIVAYRMPVIYRSEAKIIVVPQRVPESFVRSSVDRNLEDRLASIKQQVLSRTRLEQIVVGFNLYPDERKTAIMEELIQRMRTHDIDIETMAARLDGDAATFSISFQSADRRTTMRVTERLEEIRKTYRDLLNKRQQALLWIDIVLLAVSSERDARPEYDDWFTVVRVEHVCREAQGSV